MSVEKAIKSLGDAAKNIVIGLGILILTMFVTIYGMNTFYEKPEYDDFCGDVKTSEVLDNVQKCEAIGGKWNANSYERPVLEKGESVPQGYCDRYYTCEKEYDAASKVYAKKIFLTAIPIGVIVILIGAFLFNLNSVGVGLMIGGVGTLIYGAGGYWRYSDNLLKFLSSLVGLAALIAIAYWFNARFEKK
jgi:hypothetical protein